MPRILVRRPRLVSVSRASMTCRSCGPLGFPLGRCCVLAKIMSHAGSYRCRPSAMHVWQLQSAPDCLCLIMQGQTMVSVNQLRPKTRPISPFSFCSESHCPDYSLQSSLCAAPERRTHARLVHLIMRKDENRMRAAQPRTAAITEFRQDSVSFRGGQVMRPRRKARASRGRPT